MGARSARSRACTYSVTTYRNAALPREPAGTPGGRRLTAIGNDVMIRCGPLDPQ